MTELEYLLQVLICLEYGENYIKLNVDAAQQDSLCVDLNNEDIIGIMNNQTRTCVVGGSALDDQYCGITFEDILSEKYTYIVLEEGFNATSTTLVFDLLNRGLVQELKCSHIEVGVMRDVIDNLARVKLADLWLQTNGHHVNVLLQAMAQGAFSVNKLIFTSIPGRNMDALCECISSPQLTIAHLEICSGVFTSESMQLLSEIESQTWLRELTLGPEPQRGNLQRYTQLQHLLLAKHQLLAMLHGSRRQCSVSKLPVELTRMLSTFLI